ncbi:Dos2-interacting transcription regulator of RNA-Pol-II-domain-containing protein [Triangularia verruculosa]|uniref:MMS19 nucleotide excision repair protein n=1 Tax=Triangularia verruculosa TaxID=2587418 RepID=A0AAN7AW26_9PEZI|nr:Dos2-interacting transcription regulator of RNA-Pol-II-domain-containing protein [Triangularia verruculosa]
MAQFKQWALEYVLADDEPVQLELTKKAAKEIENSRASSTVVGNWAASVHQWMTLTNSNDDDQMEDGDEGVSGDIISRAKALAFLAGTLEALDKTILRPDQVQRLVGFFGAMFSYDHKAGITASAKALQQLYSMKNFKPEMGVKSLEDVCKLKEDFRLQTAGTRLEMYELFLSLVEDPAVSSELQHKYGASCGFALDLLQLCSSERDPRNLMIWFKIIRRLLIEFSPSPEVTEEIFKAFSAYFPISLRSSATPIGITAEDLKEAVRNCFSSHQRVAPFAFPFLMQKLDQGDAVTVAVKVDILRTINACIEEYENPQASVVPYVEKIWGSLKYEVRNGEVKETIDATLEVLRAITRKLDGSKTHKHDVSLIKNYIDLVFGDCRDDLSNPTYTKQAGLLLMTVVTASIRGYVLYNSSFIDIIRQNIRQPRSPTHTRDLLLLVNSIVKTRVELVKNRKDGHHDDEDQLRAETRTHLVNLFHDVYLPIWTGKAGEAGSSENDILKQVALGLGLLVSQQALDAEGEPSLLCPGAICDEISKLLTATLVKPLTLSSNDNQSQDATLEDEVVLAMRTIVMNYVDAYGPFLMTARKEILKRDWAAPSEHSLEALKVLLSRLVFIGCSEIPSNIKFDTEPQQPYNPLQHYYAFLQNFPVQFPLSPQSVAANSYILSSFHASVIWFRDACDAKYGASALAQYSSSEKNWMDEFEQLPGSLVSQFESGAIFLDEAATAIKEEDPEVYRQFLRLSLFVVRELYKSATDQAPWSEEALIQLARTASLVVQSLDGKLQVSCKLAQEAFALFKTSEDQPFSSPLSGLLTVGILQGLHPVAMEELYKSGGVAEKFICDTSSLSSSPRASDIKAAVGAIYSNKYQAGPAASEEYQTLKRVLEFWTSWVKDSVSSSDVDSETFRQFTNVAMHTIAGAVARQEKLVLDLLPVLHEAAASPSPNGEIVARSMGILVQPNSEVLNKESHAVTKRFYKQWAYNFLVRPLYELARPGNGKDPKTTARYSITILSVVKNCPFTVYQDDVESLLRLLVIALSSKKDDTILSDEAAQAQVIAALEILVDILAHEPEALKGFLKEIISGTTKVYQESAPSNSTLHKPLTMCRKLSLQVLGALPKTFEERYLLSFSPPTQRMLALACGDPVRKVREAARAARGNWARVV